jgi:hypothetical protein
MAAKYHNLPPEIKKRTVCPNLMYAEGRLLRKSILTNPGKSYEDAMLLGR